MNVRAIKCLVFAAAVAIVSIPTTARAEGYINPWAGVVFDEAAQKGVKSFGGSIGDTGNKMGIDVNFGYMSDFTGNGGPKVIDLMAGVSAGPQIGRSVHSVRPYAVGGVGLLRTSSGNAASNDFGFNAGGGLFIYFSTHLGVRGEVRYYRTLNGKDLGDFDFTRAQFGLLIR